MAVGCNQELGQNRKVNDSNGCRKEEKSLWRLFCFFRFRLDNQDEGRHANRSITSASYRAPDVRGQVAGRFGAVCT